MSSTSKVAGCVLLRAQVPVPPFTTAVATMTTEPALKVCTVTTVIDAPTAGFWFVSAVLLPVAKQVPEVFVSRILHWIKFGMPAAGSACGS